MAERPPCANPEDILAFPSETETGAAAASAAAVDTDDTLIFASESAPLGHTPVPPPSSSEVDALLEFASDTGRPQLSAPPPLPPVPAARVAEAGVFDRLRTILVRWVLPSAAAFAIGVFSVLISLREQDGIPTYVEHTVADAARPAPVFEPRIVNGMFPASDLRLLPRVEVQRLVIPPAPVTRVDARPAIQLPRPAPAATLATARRPRPAGTRGETIAAAIPSTAAPLAVEAPPIASIPLAAHGRELPDAILVAPPRSGITAEPAVMTSRDDEFGVRRALLSYETAYENLNVAAAAEVWPNVDRTALSRAFAMLKSQGLEFQSCSITVRDANATAYCRGTYQYVRKVGNPTPLLAQQQWVFKMRRAGSAWKIDDVSASQEAVLAAQRTRGQG